MTTPNPQLLARIQSIIAEQIGSDSTAIEPEAHLEDDLGLLEPDLRRLLISINQQFDDLYLNMNDLETNEVFTVGDLVQLIDDELKFA